MNEDKLAPIARGPLVDAVDKAGGLEQAIRERYPEAVAAIQHATDIVDGIESMTVGSKAELDEINALRIDAQTSLKTIESAEKHISTPLVSAQSLIRDFFRPAKDGLVGAKKTSGQKMTAHRQRVADEERKVLAEAERKERARREEEIAKLRETAAAEEEAGHQQTAAALRDTAREQARAPSAPAPVKLQETKTEGTHYRKSYVVHIDSEAILLKLQAAVGAYNARAYERAADGPGSKPKLMLGPEHFSINEKAVQALADATKGAIEIPDVRIELVEVPVTRKRRS